MEKVAFVFNRWWKNKLSLFFLLMDAGVNLAYAWLETNLVTDGFMMLVNGDMTFFEENVARMGIILTILVIVDTMRPYFRMCARVRFFTQLIKELRNPELDNDAGMFTQFGIPSMLAARKSVWCVTELGDQFVNLLIHSGWVAFALMAIYNKSARLLPVSMLGILATVILVIILTTVIHKIAKRNTKLIKERDAEDIQVIEGYEDVRANALQEKHRESLRKKDDVINHNMFKRGMVVSGLFAAYSVTDNIVRLASIWFGLRLIAEGLMDTAGLGAVYVNLTKISQRIDLMFDTFDGISENLGQIDPLMDVLKYVNLIKDGDLVFPGLSDGDEITFDNVSQRYKKGETYVEVLRNVSFSCKAGEIIGFAGGSGCGKSTLLRALLRLIPLSGGRISIGGIDVSRYLGESLYPRFGTVFQGVSVFSGSIRDNLTYFAEGTSDAEIQWACKMACLSDLVNDRSRCPKGLDTRVGPKGVDLSGGERQRIGLARALLKNPDVLIMDEATSALDNITESEVLKNIVKWARDNHKTVFMVAHRLTTLRKCDTIHYMENGRLSESGSFSELLEKEGGKFSHLWKVANME